MSRRTQRSVSVIVPPNLAPLAEEDPRTIDRFVVIGRIGGGDKAAVYAAVDPEVSSEGLRALRRLDADSVASPEDRTRLEERLRRLAAVDGRHDARPLAFDAAAAAPWVVMPFLGGVSLTQHVRKRGPMDPGMAAALAAGLAEALADLHGAGLGHGALKPDAVLLTSQGPRVLGAELLSDHDALRRRASWTAPERRPGGLPTPAADVFAWGGIVLYAATGRLPFGEGEPAQVAERAAAEEAVLEDVPGELRPLVVRALAASPEERPGARELLGSARAAWKAARQDGRQHGELTEDDTEALLREWNGIVEPSGLPRVFYLAGDTPERGGRRPGRSVLVAAGAVVALGVVGGGVWAGVNTLAGGSGAEAGEEGAAEGADEGAGQEEADASEAPEDGTAVVRFHAEEQDSPAEGPWVYTVVEHAQDAEGPWDEQWAPPEGSGPLEARIDPDAQVECARYCHNPGVVTSDEDGRGTFTELTGRDFVGYLSYGEEAVIAEVEFDDAQDEGEVPVITRITELYEPS